MSAHGPVDARRCLAAARDAPGSRTAVAALLEAQFHHMGRDVSHPAGNVLRRLGFVRQGPPPGRRTAVARYVRSSDAQLVAIWPFALCVGDRRGAALLPRRGRASWWPLATQPDCFTARELSALRAGCTACPGPLVGRALGWLADYEREVETLVGTAHREPSDPGSRASAGDGYGLQASWRTHAAAFVGGDGPSSAGTPRGPRGRADPAVRSAVGHDARDSPEAPELSRQPRMHQGPGYVFPRS